jgi:hypothetical protein
VRPDEARQGGHWSLLLAVRLVTHFDLAAAAAAAAAAAGSEFSEAVQYVAKTWLPAKQIVAAAVQERLTVDPSGAIIVLKV